MAPHYADQDALIAAFRDEWTGQHFNLDRLEQLHRAVQVKGRYLALPLGEYRALNRFADRNRVWREVATNLGERAVREALERSQIAPGDVHHLFFNTVTGLATPSIDARLCNRFRFREDIKRTPIFGLGCVGGAAGLARASDYIRAFPEHNAVLLAVELCSLTLQREDFSLANIISSGLFGDGAAAVVVSGHAPRGARLPRIVATRSVFFPETEGIMGWEFLDSGFKIVLSAQLPKLILERGSRDVDAFLGAHGLTRRDIRHWVLHTGGPKVLESMQVALELPEKALARSWASLREVGNLSSASVLHVLGDLMDSGEPSPGDWGLLSAMGPGFCAELVLLQW
jgi:alkylresorcinol/alkylpyrone synthase